MKRINVSPRRLRDIIQEHEGETIRVLDADGELIIDIANATIGTGNYRVRLGECFGASRVLDEDTSGDLIRVMLDITIEFNSDLKN